MTKKKKKTPTKKPVAVAPAAAAAVVVAAAAAAGELSPRAQRAVEYFDTRCDEGSALRQLVDAEPERAEAFYELVLLAQGHYEHDAKIDAPEES